MPFGVDTPKISSYTLIESKLVGADKEKGVGTMIDSLMKKSLLCAAAIKKRQIPWLKPLGRELETEMSI